VRAGLLDGVRLLAGYDESLWDREQAAVSHSRDRGLKLAADVSGPGSLLLRAGYRRRDRRADAYEGDYFEQAYLPMGRPQVSRHNPGSRLFHWTDRTRDEWSLSAEWSPHAAVSVFADVARGSSRYADPGTGQRIGGSYRLLQDRDRNGAPETYDILLAGRESDSFGTGTAGLTVRPWKQWSASLNYVRDGTRSRMAGRYRNVVGTVVSDDPADDWSSDRRDRTEIVSVLVEGSLAAGRVTLLAGLTRSTERGDIRNAHAAGGTAIGDGLEPDGTRREAFPRVTSRMTLVSLAAECRLREGLHAGLRGSFERWSTADWATDGFGPYMGRDDQDPATRLWFFLGGGYGSYRVPQLELFVRMSL
jgi:hypothetical protein